MDEAGALLQIDGAISNDILHQWEWLLAKSYTVVGLSAFGDLFLRDSERRIDMLDVVRGEVRQVAFCIEEFEFDLQSAELRAELFMEGLIGQLRSSGMRLKEGECYAFRTPPMLGGRLEVGNVVPWDIAKYHAGLSKLIRQISDLPPGTEVVRA